MIYEFMLFYNEFDMLELKLQEHYTKVDRFVICESNRSSNQTVKPYNLEQCWDRYKPYHDKIKYIKFDATGLEPGWKTFNAQRDHPITQVEIQENDIILIDDVDEILHQQDWHKLKLLDDDNVKEKQIQFCSATYWCYANAKHAKKQQTVVALRGKNLTNSISEHRGQAEYQLGSLEKRIPTHNLDGGVHLSWFGDKQQFLEKIDGSIEAVKYTKDRDLDTQWQDKLKGKLFHYKVKFKTDRIKLVSFEENTDFSPTMKKYILSKPHWLLNK